MESFSEITTAVFVAFGAVVMFLAIMSIRKIMPILISERDIRLGQRLHFVMLFLFIGYLGILALIFIRSTEVLLVVTGLMFFLGAFFAYLVMYAGTLTIADLRAEIIERNEAEKQLKNHKEHLEDQVKERTTELRKANTQMQDDLALAAEFQRAVLPTMENPSFLNTAFRYIPQSKVSGDVYDMTINRENEFCFFLGDATGHGVSAAFMTMMVEIGLETIPHHLAADEVLRRLNRIMASRDTGKSITGIYLRIAPTGVLRLSNAGHPPLIVIPENGEPLVELNAGGCPLGMFEDELVPYVEEVYKLKEDDKLLVYTDGIEEWENSKKEQFGADALKRCLEDNRQFDIQTLLDNVLSEVHHFSEGTPCRDDVTLHCFQFQTKAL